MNETGNNAPVKTSAGSLSDRVRSLRLTTTNETASGGWWRWIPWALCIVLLGATSLLALEAFTPIDDELLKKLAEERGLNVGKGSTTTTPLTKLGLPTTPGSASAVEIALESKGNIVPISLIQVSPKISGTVMKLYFREGDEVEAGAVLAELEDVEFKADLDRAIAVKHAAERRHGELNDYLEDEIAQTKADWLDTAAQRDQALAKYQRHVALKQRAAVAPEDFELAKSTYESLDFRSRRLELSYKMMKDEGKGPRYEKIAAAKAEIAQAQADYDKAKWRWDNTKVVAPKTSKAPKTGVIGIILSKKTEEGNIVNPAAFSNGLSASLCEMANLYEMEVDLSIAERDIAKVFKNQECRIRPEAFPNRVYTGFVSRIMPKADSSKSSVPVRVKIDFPAVDAKGKPLPMEKQGEYLRPEMGAIVTFLNRKVK